MNREQKAAVIDEVAGELKEAQAVFAVDYRGISVQQAAELRGNLTEAGARFRIVKNRLTQRAADKAGAEKLKEWLEGPTALTLVKDGDAALAAKALSRFRRANDLLAFKGGLMDGEPLTVDELESIARLPARDVLHGQFVGVLASPLTGLVRGLASMISGLAIQLEQIREQGLIGGDAPPPEEKHEQQEGAVVETTAEAPAEESPADEAPAEESPAEEAPGDPVAEGEQAEQESEQASEEEKEG